MNQHGESGDTADHEECGSHFDQAEEEEEMSIDVKNPSMVFNVNRYSHGSKSSGRRGITWYQNDVTPESKQKTTEKEIGKRFSVGILVTENLFLNSIISAMLVYQSYCFLKSNFVVL